MNIYRITKSQSFDVRFLYDFLYKKHSRDFYHKLINQQLGLEFVARMPMSAQIVGNCSWANMQALVPVAYALIDFIDSEPFAYNSGLALYDKWIEWDQERALDECIQRFYGADAVRKASYASMLAAVLFQACDHGNDQHIKRAEKILTILTLPDY